jgi:TonB family protein
MTKPRADTFTLIAALALSTVLVPLQATAQTQTQRPEAQASVNDEFERGKRLYEQGDAEGAIPLLRDVAEVRKTDADARYYYGLALSRAGHAKDARKAFEKTLKLRPDDALARVGLAYSLLLLDKLSDAEREAQRALKHNPQPAEARYIVAVIRFREEKYVEAEHETQEALRLMPDFPAASYLEGHAILSQYLDESERRAEQYPIAPDASKEERQAVLEKREQSLGQFKPLMLAVAEQLDAAVKSQPNNSDIKLWHEQAETLRFYGHASGETASVFRSSEVTTRAIITFKPEPGFTEEARQNNTKGNVRLRAVLAADGHVRHVAIIKRLPDGLTERCVEAARRIRFTPATIGGHRVSQFVVLEYNFNIY